MLLTQADEGIIAHCGDCPKDYAAGSLDGPFITLFEQQCTDKAQDGVIVGEDADDLCSPRDFLVQSLDRVGRVKSGPMLPGKGHVGKLVLLGAVHESSELRYLWPDLVSDVAPLSACRLQRVLSEGRCDEGGDDAPAATNHRWGHSPSIGLPRKTFTFSSISSHSRDTWLLGMPLMPMALTRSSTDRVKAPWI